MRASETPGYRFYCSLMGCYFCDVERLRIDAPLGGCTSSCSSSSCCCCSPSILETSSPRSILERCDVIRAHPRPRSFLNVLQLVAVNCVGLNPGVAILVHDVERGGVYCSLHLYEVCVGVRDASAAARTTGSWRTTIALSGCAADVRMIVVERLLLFFQPGPASGSVLLVDTSDIEPPFVSLTPQRILEGYSFLTCSAFYDDATRCALLSLLDNRELLTVEIPVDLCRRSDATTATSSLRLAVPPASLHFHVCQEIVVICPSSASEKGWTVLFFIGNSPLCCHEVGARVCHYYCRRLDSVRHSILLCMEDGSVQSFLIGALSSVVKGGCTKVLHGGVDGGMAMSFSPVGKDCVALITRRQCVLLSVSDVTSSGVVSVLSVYHASAESNMIILKLQFPPELHGNFPFVLLVSTLGSPCVRGFSFQRMSSVWMHSDAPLSATNSSVSDNGSEATTWRNTGKSAPPTRLLAHIQAALHGKRVEQSSLFFEPLVKEDSAILTLCQGFDSASAGGRCPPYELLALDPRLRGFVVHVSCLDFHDCYVLRDTALHDALHQLAAKTAAVRK